MSLWLHIEQHIARATGRHFSIEQSQGVSGGDINTATRITAMGKEYFVKTNHLRFGDMFAAEAEGLKEMAASNTIRVPEIICYGDDGAQCYIVMEYLPLGGRPDSRLLGEQLAAMHKVTAEDYGWYRDNTIGATPQHNGVHNDWVSFWREQRLGFQLELAARNGYGGELQALGDRLLDGFGVLFSDYTPPASMLHGDLWSGNYGGLTGGEPVIFDPAFYYGDREADIAMTTLFGGFSADFYAAYQNAWPLDDGYRVRKTFYNLYHIINHANLFGGGYQGQAVAMMKQLLAEI